MTSIEIYFTFTLSINNNMNYSEKQIENAKRNYINFLEIRTVESYEPQHIGMAAAEQRCEHHNGIVTSILAGNKELEKEWKLFFLKNEVKADQKRTESEEKKQANLSASADILAPIKSARKTTAFGNWLNTTGNPYRSEHFSKKYTVEAVNAFLQTI